MKIGERLKYQQLVDCINFPVVIYVYETRRIIAINKRAKNILVPEGRLLRYMPDAKIRTQISRQILDKVSDVFLGAPIIVGIREIRIDLEVSSIELDGKHIVIMIFDYTENHSFGDKYLNYVPRFFWKDKKLKLKGVNYFCKSDIQNSGVALDEVEDHYDNDAKALLIENETSVIKSKQPLWNVMQLIQLKNERGKFIRIQRIPIINKNGTVEGILGSYNYLLNKAEHDEEIDWLKSEKSRLTQLLTINETIFFRVRADDEWSVEYVTPNIKKLGYRSKDFYLKNITFRDLVMKEDMKTVVQDFMSNRKLGTKRVELEYRIKKADGSPVWVNGLCIYTDSEEVLGEGKYVDCILRDITEIKTLQKELEVSKDVMHAKLEKIKKGEFPIKVVQFTDLFNIDDLLVFIKSFSDMMNISCTITDYVGRTLCNIIQKPYIEEEVYQYYESREGRRIFRKLYKQVRSGESNSLYDEVNDLYIYGIPFNVEDKCIGILDILAKEKVPSDSPIFIFLNNMVKKLCSSVQINLELLRERDRCERVEAQLKIAQKRGELLSLELEIALTEDNLYMALNKIIMNLTQYIYVGEILLFRQTSALNYYEKQVEWNFKGEEIRRITHVYEGINLEECKELVVKFKHTNIVTYQQSEISPYLLRQLRPLRVKALALIMFELELGENVIIALCDSKADSEWTSEKITLLTNVSNIIRIVLQRIINKKKIIKQNKIK